MLISPKIEPYLYSDDNTLIMWANPMDLVTDSVTVSWYYCAGALAYEILEMRKELQFWREQAEEFQIELDAIGRDESSPPLSSLRHQYVDGETVPSPCLGNYSKCCDEEAR